MSLSAPTQTALDWYVLNSHQVLIDQIVATQAERAVKAEEFHAFLLNDSRCIGVTWWRHTDQPPLGGQNGEDSNYGLVDVHDDPYPLLVQAFTRINPNAMALHHGVPGTAAPHCATPNCPLDCSKHGCCENGICKCWLGYSGPGCSSGAGNFDTNFTSLNSSGFIARTSTATLFAFMQNRIVHHSGGMDLYFNSTGCPCNGKDWSSGAVTSSATYLYGNYTFRVAAPCAGYVTLSVTAYSPTNEVRMSVYDKKIKTVLTVNGTSSSITQDMPNIVCGQFVDYGWYWTNSSVVFVVNGTEIRSVTNTTQMPTVRMLFFVDCFIAAGKIYVSLYEDGTLIDTKATVSYMEYYAVSQCSYWLYN